MSLSQYRFQPLPIFIRSFIHAISIAPLQVLYYSEALPTQHGYCMGVSRRSAQATAGKGLAQGPYMAARAQVEPMTLRTKGVDSTKAPPRSIYGRQALIIYYYLRLLDKQR